MGENKGGTDCSSAIKYCFNWKIFRFMCLTPQKAPHQKKLLIARLCAAHCQRSIIRGFATIRTRVKDYLKTPNRWLKHSTNARSPLTRNKVQPASCE